MSHDIIQGGCDKKMREFQILYRILCLQTETSAEKFKRIMK
jgi:hypothetical protein